MTRQIGGFSLEGRHFIVDVPEGWKEMDPLPDVSADDRWFDHISDFKAALRGPWIRKPVRRSPWQASATLGAQAVPATPPVTTPSPHAIAELRRWPPSHYAAPAWAMGHRVLSGRPLGATVD